MSPFFIAGIGLAVFLEFLLISKKNKSGSDKILAIWMFLILLHLFLFFLHYTGNILDVSFLLGVEHPLPLFHGVFLYLYVSSLTGQLPRRKMIIALHFLPAAVLYASLTTFFTLPADQKVFVYQNKGAGYELFSAVKWYTVALSGVCYVVWSIVLLRRHAREIRDRFSNLEKVNLRWLQILTFGMGGIWLLVIFFGGDVVIFAGVVVFVFLIGFHGVRQTAIFTPSRSEDTGPDEKYRKSGLTEKTAEELHHKLKQLMLEEALYRKSDLSIADLSMRLGVHPNYLSQAINQREKRNFYDFVNGYRIEEFKQLIAQQKNRRFTLLSLAFECGFSSKTSFNRCFKNATGMTPSQYVRQVAGTEVPPE